MPPDRRLTTLAITTGLGALALGGFAWLTNADAIFVEIANAAIAMCM